LRQRSLLCVEKGRVALKARDFAAFSIYPGIRLIGADEALSLQRESELRFPEVSTHLFRCLPNCVDDLVLCLGIIQLRLQKRRPGVEFLGYSRIGLGTERLSPRQLLMQYPTGFGTQA
jgi:hypothetical protein